MNILERRAVMDILADAIGQDISDEGCSILAYDGGSFQGTSNMSDEELIEELESRNMTIEKCLEEYRKNRPNAVEIDESQLPKELRELIDKE